MRVRIAHPETWSAIGVPPGGGLHKRLDRYFVHRGSEEEMRYVIREYAKQNPDWRQEHLGWAIYPLRIEDPVVVE